VQGGSLALEGDSPHDRERRCHVSEQEQSRGTMAPLVELVAGGFILLGRPLADDGGVAFARR